MFDCFQNGFIIVDGVTVGDYEFRCFDARMNPVVFMY